MIEKLSCLVLLHDNFRAYSSWHSMIPGATNFEHGSIKAAGFCTLSKFQTNSPDARLLNDSFANICCANIVSDQAAFWFDLSYDFALWERFLTWDGLRTCCWISKVVLWIISQQFVLLKLFLNTCFLGWTVGFFEDIDDWLKVRCKDYIMKIVNSPISTH